MPEEKSREKKKIVPSERKETVQPTKKELATVKKEQKPAILAPYIPWSTWRDFDRAFERFRRDFEDILWPSERLLAGTFPTMPSIEPRLPSVDLEDRGKDFLLTAEIPGFKKEDIDIQVTDDSVEIRTAARWKYDDRSKNYIRRERASESCYRRIELPEEIKTDKAEASMKDGVLEITLPKKTPKPKKKVTVK